MGRLGYVPSLLCAEFVMGRVCHLPSLLWAELSLNPSKESCFIQIMFSIIYWPLHLTYVEKK